MKDPLVNMHAMVERFNRDLVGVRIPYEPMILDFDRGEFRLGHLREELTEIEDGLADNDLHGTVDGLIDLTYVALGALIEMGVCVNGVFEEVHAANMRKVRSVAGNNPQRPTDTVAKPEGWKPADLTPYLELTKLDLATLLEIKRHNDADEMTSRGKIMAAAKPQRPKILVMGYARHGKDTVAEIISQYGLNFTSSSMFCAEHVMMPYFGNSDVVYHTVKECYEDRGNHRAEWYNAIRQFNYPDASALGRAIFEKYDIYCGLRSSAEFHALKNTSVFDHVVWVDASDRGVPPEDDSSCTVRPWMADYVVDNGGDLSDLEFNVDQLMTKLLL